MRQYDAKFGIGALAPDACLLVLMPRLFRVGPWPLATAGMRFQASCSEDLLVTEPGWLWAVFTVIAAFAQTVRNAMQRELTTGLGTVGATHVRFLFGFPFVLLALAAVTAFSAGTVPRPPLGFW